MQLRNIIIETFTDCEIPEQIDNLRMGDIPQWDSIGNFNLLLAIEKKYGIQFDFEKIEKLNSVSAIKIELENALSKL